MNINHPDTNSEAYRQFLGMTNQKVSLAANWLASRKIDYVWNYWIGNHLYRLYIPTKELLLDFEYYPVNNIEYNYIRINFDTDVIQVLEKLFPNIILDTEELDVWKLTQLATNKFLREQGVSPIYDKNVLRIALVQDKTIYQCIIIKSNKIVANVTRRNCAVPYGTYILLRYLNEIFGISEILIKESCNNSYTNALYQILNLPIVSQTCKKKIWWSANGTQWKIKKEQTDQFIPFYYCEDRVYRYG
jgi:hypothetical protein